MALHNLRRVIFLGLLLAAAFAGWLMPRAPLAAGVLLVLLAAVALFQWRTVSLERRVVAAGLRCDLGALDALVTRGGVLARLHGGVVLFHHGGFERELPSLCSCGSCEKDALDREIDAARRVAKLSWQGDAELAYRLATDDEMWDEHCPPTLREFVGRVRLMNRVVSYAALAQHAPLSDEERDVFSNLLGFVETQWPALRWPARLAAAREAASRADDAGAREHLLGMPNWPDGSALQRVRRDLEQRLGS